MTDGEVIIRLEQTIAQLVREKDEFFQQLTDYKSQRDRAMALLKDAFDWRLDTWIWQQRVRDLKAEIEKEQQHGR